MMEIIFENESGALHFGGGRSRWNITDYSGFMMPEKNFETIRYVQVPGQVTISQTPGARLMTLRGDCCAAAGEISSGFAVLNQAGEMTIFSRGVVRRIAAYCSHFEMKKPRGQYREFIIQFTADDPYFEGREEKSIPLFRRSDLVSGTFTLPCVFTEKTSRQTISNNGDVETEPVLHIVCNRQGEAQEQEGVLLENQTTGVRFQLNYAMAEGEIITVDVPNRQVRSNLKTEENNQGNLLVYLSEDTFLHKLALRPGGNFLMAAVLNVGSDITVVCIMKEKYLGMVM